MKIQVVLMLFVCYRLVKSIYFASCNNPCNASEESHCSHSTCDICCYRDYSLDDSGTPPPQPRELKSNRSINHYNETFTVIGLNISWIDEVSTMYNSSSLGYSLTITRERSSAPTYVHVAVVKQSYFIVQKYKKIQLNFNRFGLDDCIEPGEKYLISLRALPIHDDLGSNSLYSKVQVPDCTDITVQHTYNCLHCYNAPDDSEDGHNEKETPDTPTAGSENPIEEPITISSLSDFHIALYVICPVVGACFIIAVSYTIYYKLTSSANKQPGSCFDKLLVVISSCDASAKSEQSFIADQLSCFFKHQQLDVIYTLWHSTKLSQTNAIQWVTNQIEAAHHVIVVVTPAAVEEQQLDEGANQPLINRSHDPFVIARKKIEVDLEHSSKYSIVYFDPSLPIPSSMFHIKSRFHLPQQAADLCEKLLGNKAASTSLQNCLLQPRNSAFKIKAEIGKVETSNSRNEFEGPNDSVQLDSGYVTTGANSTNLSLSL